MEIHNHDVAGLIRRLRRFRYETVKADSSMLADVNKFDLQRAKSYITACRTYLDWIVAQPQLDLPESAPRGFQLPDSKDLPEPENESLYDVVNMYDALEEEIANSQSARMGSGVISHDEGRIRAILDKLDNFILNYVEPTQPLDLPESAPKRESTGDGRKGVNVGGSSN